MRKVYFFTVLKEGHSPSEFVVAGREKREFCFIPSFLFLELTWKILVALLVTILRGFHCYSLESESCSQTDGPHKYPAIAVYMLGADVKAGSS